MRVRDVDENRSVWTAGLSPYAPSAALAGTVTADVAIVGGGLTGVSTAWHLAERLPGLRVVLLEARAIGNGASGRNGGQVLNWINGVPSSEPELVRKIFAFTQDGVALIERIARAHAPDAGFARNGCLEVSTSAARADALHAEVERLQGFGIPVRWLPAQEVGLASAHGALLDPTAGRVNTLALLRGWKQSLLERGVAIFESTPVLRVEQGREIRLTAPAGEVRARAVVLATNAYTPALGWFRDAVLPLHSHVLATEPLADAKWRATGFTAHDGFSDDLDRIAYGCRTADDRLVLGGGSNAAYAYRYGGAAAIDRASPAAARGFVALGATLERYFPALAPCAPAARWTGLLDLSFDRAPSIGVGGEAGNVYHALGYSGHGVVLGVLAGRVLADLHAGDHDAWRDYPFYQRRLPRIPPEPLRWLGYQVYTRLTGRSPRRR